MWRFTGKDRPHFAHRPKNGQESVWDYPRPPKLAESQNMVLVSFNDKLIARSEKVLKLCETASPPQYYIPFVDVNFEYLQPAKGVSFCEWKGAASYWRLSFDKNETPVGWSYDNPNSEYQILKNYISFFPGRVDCFLNCEKVRPQPGNFYGGWITDEISGPFKGEPGTTHW